MILGNIAGLHTLSRGLKVSMLKELAIERNAHTISLTESHLSGNVKEAEISIEGYTIFRKDRAEDKMRGGVITYLKNDLAKSAKELTSGSIGLNEYQCIYIKDPNILLMNVYRSPNSSFQDFKEVLRILEDTVDKCPRNLTTLLTGDFNFPDIKWPNGEASYNTTSNNSVDTSSKNIFTRFIDRLFLSQLVDQPTRRANILDLILTNNHELITEIDVLPDSEYLSDHRLIIAKTTLSQTETPTPNTHPPPQSFRSLNFFHKNINWDSINQKINEIDWENHFLNNPLHENLNFFYQEILNIAREQVPKKKIKKKYPKIPDDRRALMRKRAKFRKKIAMSRNQPQITRLKQLIANIEGALRVSHENERLANENRAIECIKTNPKYFFSFARSKSKTKTQIGPFEKDGVLIQDPHEKAEILREQFESVFTRPETNSNPFIPNPTQEIENPLDDLTITEEDIAKQIKKLPKSAAAGPDEIPATLLKNCIDSMKAPLSKIWRKSLEEGCIPDILKTGYITPIYKGGDRKNPQNYRPISLTSHITKIFEKIVREKITKYMNENNKFNNNQHGFRNGRSCISQLLNHYNKILENLEKGHEIDVIYLDFAKAFDKVHHGLLLQKLQNIGITGKLKHWIKEFLCSRKQYVTVEGAVSNPSEVLSGVPQGTVLGPILFLIYISDIDEEISDSDISCFADDTRVLKTIKDVNDRIILQDDLNNIYTWADRNKMKFNENKFETINYVPSRRSAPSTHIYTTQNGSQIERKTETRDLGIIMNSDATFSNNITAMVKKGKGQAGWALRTFQSRDSSLMLTLLKTLIQPLLEYGCEIWNPHLSEDIARLEKIQRDFTRKIEGMNGKNYWERLQALKLNSLERRRERYIIIHTWKILNGLAPNLEGANKITIMERLRSGVACNYPALNTNPTRIRTLKEESFAVKGPKLFNNIPNEIRDECLGISLDTFKSRLDKFLATVPDKPKLPGRQYSQQAEGNSLIDQTGVQRRNN